MYLWVISIMMVVELELFIGIDGMKKKFMIYIIKEEKL